MITHDRFLEFAAAEIDFPLARNEREALEHHLDTCVACRAEAAEIRFDARAIAELPQLRLNPERADHILGSALVRTRRRPSLRLVALAALLALAALGALAVGAEFLRESEKPPLAVFPPPSNAPSNRPALPPAAWTVVSHGEAVTSIDSLPVAIAESNGRLVAIGRPLCITDVDSGDVSCVAQVRRSTDGVTWTGVASPAQELNEIFFTSGPEIGMSDIAGAPQGLAAIGYDGAAGIAVGVWTSLNGDVWERQPSGSAFAGARVNAITAGGPGWVIVGSVHLTDGPRGAIWTSPDGRIWTRFIDGPVFDVGGYLDTGEEPGSGSVRDVVADGRVIVAVGDTCDELGRACRSATWRSSDAGASWVRGTGPDVVGNLTAVIHTDREFMAFGQSCELVPSCTPRLASSVDGTTWSSTDLDVLPAVSRVLSAVAFDGGVVALASRENGLIVTGTDDGRTWEVLHDEFLNETPETTPPPGFATLWAAGGVRTSTGGVIFVGYFEGSTETTFAPVVIHVDAGSP